MTRRVVVLDYGSGNIHSVHRALARVGADVTVISRPADGLDADGVVLPGVGAYTHCVNALDAVGGRGLITERVAAGRPVLGICVGLQILFEAGREHGILTKGLGLLPGEVTRLLAPRVPHMGWNTVDAPDGDPLFEGLGPDDRFYFVHSYAARPTRSLREAGARVTTAVHGEPFVAAVSVGALSATQFHPEKSGDVGATLLSNWVNGLRGECMLTLLPAVDVSDGRAVQLVQGKAGSERVFGEPRAAALRWQEQGADWIHLVDLDAAFGRGSNADLLAGVIGALDVQVELSGGIRDDASLRAALATGARRVNIGTAALEDPDWCDRVVGEYGDRVAIGLDVRGTRLAARGWTRDGGELYEVLDRLEAAGCGRYVVTDVASDGMLAGPNLALLRDVCSRAKAPVIASGGVSTLDDLRALAALEGDGVEGAIAGTALYTGAFTVAEALEVLREEAR